jgi:hypothetical protein
MQFFFLDVVDADVSRPVDLTFLAVITVTILVEALLMWLLRYNKIPRSLLHSFIINAASLAVGYLLLEIAPGLFGRYRIPDLLLLLLITIAVELPLLYLLNKQKAISQTVKTASLVNLATYLLFYIYIILTQ